MSQNASPSSSGQSPPGGQGLAQAAARVYPPALVETKLPEDFSRSLNELADIAALAPVLQVQMQQLESSVNTLHSWAPDLNTLRESHISWANFSQNTDKKLDTVATVVANTRHEVRAELDNVKAQYIRELTRIQEQHDKDTQNRDEQFRALTQQLAAIQVQAVQANQAAPQQNPRPTVLLTDWLDHAPDEHDDANNARGSYNSHIDPKAFNIEMPRYAAHQSQDVNEWLDKVEIVFRAKSIFDLRSRLCWLRPHLDGQAGDFYDQITLDRPSVSWADFRDIFSKRFSFRAGMYQHRNTLENLRLQGEDIDGYNLEFRRLKRLLPDMSVQDALYNYERGLSKDLKVELFTKNPSTVEEAMEIARIWQLAHSSKVFEISHFQPISFHGRSSSTPMEINQAYGSRSRSRSRTPAARVNIDHFLHDAVHLDVTVTVPLVDVILSHLVGRPTLLKRLKRVNRTEKPKLKNVMAMFLTSFALLNWWI